MFLRNLFTVFLICVLYSSNIYALRFCSKNSGGYRYFPLFTIDQYEFFDQYQMEIKCYNIPDSVISGKTFLNFKTNGFDVDYRNNILALASVLCGAQEACQIPLVYKNKNLDYIHVSVWPKDNSMTGVLSVIYR